MTSREPGRYTLTDCQASKLHPIWDELASGQNLTSDKSHSKIIQMLYIPVLIQAIRAQLLEMWKILLACRQSSLAQSCATFDTTQQKQIPHMLSVWRLRESIDGFVSRSTEGSITRQRGKQLKLPACAQSCSSLSRRCQALGRSTAIDTGWHPKSLAFELYGTLASGGMSLRNGRLSLDGNQSIRISVGDAADLGSSQSLNWGLCFGRQTFGGIVHCCNENRRPFWQSSQQCHKWTGIVSLVACVVDMRALHTSVLIHNQHTKTAAGD